MWEHRDCIKRSFLCSHIKYIGKKSANIELVGIAANKDIVGKGVNRPFVGY